MKSFRGWTTSGRLPAAAAPIAIPAKAFSQFGMSKTRDRPNLRKASRVVPKIPLKSSTPMPAMKTFGSVSMHWTVASLIACQYLSRRMRSLYRA